MNPSFVMKAFPSFILMFHQKAIFCCRNGELRSMVVLTVKTEPSCYTTTLLITTRVLSLMHGPCMGEGNLWHPILAPSMCQLLALQRGGGTAADRQLPSAQSLASGHHVPSLGQQQFPTACRRRWRVIVKLWRPSLLCNHSLSSRGKMSALPLLHQPPTSPHLWWRSLLLQIHS